MLFATYVMDDFQRMWIRLLRVFVNVGCTQTPRSHQHDIAETLKNSRRRALYGTTCVCVILFILRKAWWPGELGSRYYKPTYF